MNKKIFTLLAGAFMGFAAVSSVTAQAVDPLEQQQLRVKPYDNKKPSLKFNEGANEGYFYLQLDSMMAYDKATNQQKVIGFTPTKTPWPGAVPIDTFGTIRKGVTLYMGPDSAGQNALWLDVMGRISNPGLHGTPVTNAYPNASMALESAAALWCVTIQKYHQGQNPTFDFTNKLQRMMLEVNVYGHEAWEKDPIDGWRMSRYKSAANPNAQTPGSISAWEFSETYKTGVKGGRPLVAYLDETMDTVAVLVGDTLHKLGYVQVKIAPATDVKAGKINGMLLFTLKEAMPFALDQKSFETVLGTESTRAARSLVFTPNGTPNLFTDKKWNVEYLSGNANAMLIDSSAWTNKWKTNYEAWDVAPVTPGAGNPWFSVAASHMGQMGYVALKNGGKYLYVDTVYYNSGNSQFLKFAENATFPADGSPMVGQFAWRLVYYPSGDSIYINPFSATYVPTYDKKAITDSTRFATDSVVRSWYTFTAYPTPALMADTLPMYGSATPASPALDVPLEERVTARLKWGVNPNRKIGAVTPGAGAPIDYSYYHRLYVSLQNLTVDGQPGTRVTLHNTRNNGVINTKINFGCYEPCKLATSDRVTIDPDLYLIRNEKGQYLHVPLYSAQDSAVWVYLDKNVHPEELPSFQWIVEKRFKNAEASPINIINREFGQVNMGGMYPGNYGLAFLDIQMKKDQHAPFKGRTKTWGWNKEKVNSNIIDFEKAKGNMSAKNAPTFIRLPKQYKNNPNLGYQWIDRDTAAVNLYAFNYRSGIDNTKFLSVGPKFEMGDYPKTDTLVYLQGKDCFNIGYFRLDTVNADAGHYKPYGYGVKNGMSDENGIWKKNQVADLVQLKRQAYRIKYENPFKYCLGSLHLSNGEQHRYSLSSNLRYSNIIGRPLFFLRDVYMEADGEKNFALVQVMDTLSIQTTGGGLTPDSQFEKYLVAHLGKQLAGMIMNNLRKAGEFNPGLFVAAVEEQAPMKLKYVYRGDVQTRVSTFRLKKDADPIYRRFNTELEGKNPGDAPETVKFFTSRSVPTGKNYLFENTGALNDQKAYYRAKKNYLGLVSINSNPNVNTAIYVDTAYVNRGTGYIKPQYMLMIRPTVVEDALGCDDNGDLTVPLPGYRRGMYLINATDSAKADAGTPNENDYLWGTAWNRLVFTDAIHANDALYILGGADLKDLYTKVDPKGNTKMLDLKKLDAVSDPTPAAPKNGKIRKIALGDNFHKDCVFSFRLIERRSCNKPGGDFLIESETTDRGQYPMIAPCEGGWIKIQNGVPVISRSDVVKAIADAEIFNVEATDEAPVANEVTPAVTEVKVVAENGAVTILNAAGKKVVVTNVLGQTLVNTVLTSDRATVAAPQGVVVVAVEGEAAVKAMVK